MRFYHFIALIWFVLAFISSLYEKFDKSSYLMLGAIFLDVGEFN